MVTTAVQAKAPWHLWLVGVLALLFNTVGVFDFIMIRADGAAYLASSGMTPAQIAHYQAIPSWMTIVWAIGVFGAFAASILLLLRMKTTSLIFAMSLAAFLISVLYHYVLSGDAAIVGPAMAITDLIIAALLIFFIWYSQLMTSRHVLR